MFYKGFRFNIVARVVLIVVLSLLFTFMIQREMLFVPLTLFLFLCAAVLNLVTYIERSNRNLTHLLLSIRQGAYTETLASGNRGKPFQDMTDAMNEVVAEFGRLHVDKELHYQYLQALNENLSVAILSFEAGGKLLMMNPAAKRLLNFKPIVRLQDFKAVDPNLYATIIQMKPEERVVVRAFIGEDHYNLNVQVKEIILQDKLVRIVLLQNLNQELEAREIEAWHQLMSVLTHEIMNSVTPLVSLTGAIQSILYNEDGSAKEFRNLDQENVDDVHSSLRTITSRSKGLLSFVNAYKQYAKPIELHVESADIITIVSRIMGLLSPDVEQSKLKLHFRHEAKPMEVKMDVSLMEQVFINLIKNAIEAVPHDGTGVITIDIRRKVNQNIEVLISDNGDGIEPETLQRIFIPFFTTKSKGTGIGLSLSRQIIRLHNGNIRVSSNVGKGTVFTVELRAG